MLNTSGHWIRKGQTIVLFGIRPEDDSGEGELLEFEERSTQHPTLRRGASGAAVRELQSKLASAGFSAGAADGQFGPGTEAAVRAFQRARGLGADGVVGAATWAALDAKSGGGNGYVTPTPAPVAGSTPAPGSAAARVVAEARKHVGYREGPNNSNKFSAHFGVPNVAWCVYFVSYVHTMAGIPMNIGSSDALLAFLRQSGKFFNDQPPRPGDVCVFDWNPADSDPAEHGGIVETVYRDAAGRVRITTIEGNSGDAVSRRDRAFDDRTIVGYGRMT